MLAVLSPAKSLRLDPTPPELPVSQPAFMDDTSALMRTTRGLSQTRIRELMNISSELAKLNYDRFRSFELPFGSENALPAALMFDGDVYRGLAARELDAKALAWAQDHIAILSGMFGLLRPLDLIQPYRLEMGTRLKTRRGANLYAFWGESLGNKVREQLQDHKDPTVVNLASNEYFKALKARKTELPVVTCVFHDYKDAARTPKVISFLAKRARGMMARFIIEQRVDQSAGLKDFKMDRYRFRADISDENTFVFGRKFIPAKAR
jgi:uncharacterized protein